MSFETIEIEFKYPFNCRLKGSSAEELDFEVKFSEGEFDVQAVMETEAPVEIKTGALKGLYFCETKNLLVYLKSADFLKAFGPDTVDLTNNDNFKKTIYQINMKILNRVLRNLRVYGISPHVREQPPSTQEAEAFLCSWNTRLRIGSGEWLPLAYTEEATLTALQVRNVGIGWGYGPKTVEVSTYFKRDIIEAIEDNLQPPPEQEFWVNALEFLREQNYRMAVVEAVIGLEIVLVQYISLFLEKKKRVSKKKTEDFFVKAGLSHLFNVVLRLIAPENDLAGVNLDMVSKTIGWRNKVAHKGKLPEDIPEHELRQGIASVVEVNQILRLKIHQIESEPMFQTITEKVKQKCGSTSVCWIFPITRRKIYMDLSVLDSPSWFTKQKLEEIIKFTIELIRAKISRFDPQEDLYAKVHHFSRLQPVAIYAKGELKIFQTYRQSIESDSFIT